MFQHERSSNTAIKRLNVISTPLFNCGDQSKKNKMEQLRTGFLWLQHYLVGQASPFDELNLMMRIRLMQDPLLCRYRVKVQEMVDLLNNNAQQLPIVKMGCS